MRTISPTPWNGFDCTTRTITRATNKKSDANVSYREVKKKNAVPSM